MEKRLRLLTAIAAIAACLVLPQSSFAASGMEIAIQDDVAYLEGPDERLTLALQAARELQVTRIRVNASWSRLIGPQASRKAAPSAVKYNWTGYDRLVREAAAFGIRVQIALIGPAPAWATKRRKITNNQPDAKQFGKFATEAARHFKGKVDRYSIWNEPNHDGGLTPLRKSASIYRGLYQAGYSAIKKSAPSAKVLIGETSPYEIPGKAVAPVRFLRDLFCLGPNYKRLAKAKPKDCKPLKADGWAHHPYEFKHQPSYKLPGADNATIGTLNNLTRALDKLATAKLLRTNGGKRLDLYLTEFGYHTRGPKRLPDGMRATYTKQGFRIARAHPRVRQMLQYQLFKMPSAISWDTSILDADGSPSTVFDALAAWAKQQMLDGLVLEPGSPIALPGLPLADTPVLHWPPPGLAGPTGPTGNAGGAGGSGGGAGAPVG